MVRLSINVNKVATLRNSRGGRVPSVIEAVRVSVDAGAPGITVHPRADRRHITPDDVLDIATELAPLKQRVEYNIEGDPRPDWIDLVKQVRPHQCTLVPVRPGEITSQAGWSPNTPRDEIAPIVADMRALGVRVSVFIDPEEAAVEWAKSVGADRVEIYTEPYARAFERGDVEGGIGPCRRAAMRAHQLGLGVNAGHDLDLDNLVAFRALPHLAEVSIGHAVMSRALFVGLARVVREYLDVLAGKRIN
jgi:pyridoxine 5-phosphate synthase